MWGGHPGKTRWMPAGDSFSGHFYLLHMIFISITHRVGVMQMTSVLFLLQGRAGASLRRLPGQQQLSVATPFPQTFSI